VKPSAAPENIADGIDRHGEPRLLTPHHEKITHRLVGIVESQTRQSTVASDSYVRGRLDRGPEPVHIDTAIC
jgi:hypothetical protein